MALAALCLTLALTLLSPASPARAEHYFCVNFPAQPGNLGCHDTGFSYASIVKAERGAYLVCASARNIALAQVGGWWCTTTGRYVSHIYGGEIPIQGWIRSVELPPGAVNWITGWVNVG